MTSLDIIDSGGRATLLAMTAQTALTDGDTDQARRVFEEAGSVLEASIPNLKTANERALARFLASTQYYMGGLYDKALSLCQDIKSASLPENVRHLFPVFSKNVKTRSHTTYRQAVLKALKDGVANKMW